MVQLALVRFSRRAPWSVKRWDVVHRRNARRLYRAFVRLRGVYIKLGQILSIMGTFLPRAYVEELEGLQDEVPPQPYEVIVRSFTDAFGKSPAESFTAFSRVPIAAASLGQVHEARDAEDRRLAVKVLYPKIRTVIRIDLIVLGWALAVYRRFVPVRQLERVHEQLDDLLRRETDLGHEAACLSRMAANFEDDDDVLFPRVVAEFSCATVLTMTFMDGVKITNLAALKEMDLDPEQVATKLVRVFYKQVFVHRFFHADPHPGNFFVQRGPDGQPRIVILDFGSASELSDHLADGMLDILSGLLTRNDDLVVRGIETIGFVAEDGDRAMLERTTRRYFEKLLNLNLSDFTQVGQVGIDMATHIARTEERRQEIRELMKSVQYPMGWFYVERAVIILFGLTLQLAPKLNTLRLGMPYVVQFMAEGRTVEARASSQAAIE